MSWLRQALRRGPKAGYYDDPSGYWNRRHSRFDEQLDGVGMIGLGEEGNRADYEAKWEHIGSALRRLEVPEGSEVLDAGCGIGYFTERLVAFGYRVTAVDFSEEATSIASRRIGDAATFTVSPLHEYRPDRTFDAIVCIDVLFHVVDDGQWQRAVENLVALTRPGGFLLIQDHLVTEEESAESAASGTHTHWRTLEAYRAAVGQPPEDIVTYQLPAAKDTKDLLIFRL